MHVVLKTRAQNRSVFAIAFWILWDLLKVNLLRISFRVEQDIPSREPQNCARGDTKSHRRILPIVKRVYRGERDSHRVCASDLPIEIAPAITKVGQSVVSLDASAHGNGREKYKKNESGRRVSLRLPKL